MEQRRVVVTGLGLVCGVGTTTPEGWEGLLAGRSGMSEIKAVDLTGHPVRFAAEVKDFDPLLFVDRKEARKMGRFIHFALAASAEAMEHSGLKVTEENHDRIGVHIGSGIGGFDVIEREHINLLNGGPRKVSPLFLPGAHTHTPPPPPPPHPPPTPRPPPPPPRAGPPPPIARRGTQTLHPPARRRRL